MHNTSSGPPIPFASSARPARPVDAVASAGALAEGHPLGEWAYSAYSGAAHPYRPEPASEPIVRTMSTINLGEPTFPASVIWSEDR